MHKPVFFVVCFVCILANSSSGVGRLFRGSLEGILREFGNRLAKMDMFKPLHLARSRKNVPCPRNVQRKLSQMSECV